MAESRIGVVSVSLRTCHSYCKYIGSVGMTPLTELLAMLIVDVVRLVVGMN